VSFVAIENLFLTRRSNFDAMDAITYLQIMTNMMISLCPNYINYLFAIIMRFYTAFNMFDRYERN